MDKWLCIIGTWLIADGFASIWAYKNDPNQGWVWDHPVRVFRALLGILLIIFGFRIS